MPVVVAFARERFERFIVPDTVRFPPTSALPCTAKSVPGVVVPTPTFPVDVIIKAVEVAEAVEVETLKRFIFEFVEVAETERRAQGEDEEMPREFEVLFQKKELSPLIAEAPLQKVTWPVLPEPVIEPPPPELIHVPPIEKHPPVRFKPFAKVEVAFVLVALKESATTTPATESFAYGDDVPIPTRWFIESTTSVPASNVALLALKEVNEPVSPEIGVAPETEVIVGLTIVTFESWLILCDEEICC